MKRLDNIDWHYTPAAKTNIVETLRKMGFEPPSEDKRYQEKWSRYRNALSINERSSTSLINN
jgi:hypothetical protein